MFRIMIKTCLCSEETASSLGGTSESGQRILIHWGNLEEASRKPQALHAWGGEESPSNSGRDSPRPGPRILGNQTTGVLVSLPPRTRVGKSRPCLPACLRPSYHPLAGSQLKLHPEVRRARHVCTVERKQEDS